MGEAPTLLRQFEAAKFMGYSINYFKRLPIPHIGEGRAKRYRLETLEKWIAENERCPASTFLNASGKTKTVSSKPQKSTARKSGSENPTRLTFSEALEKRTNEMRLLKQGA